MSKRANPQDAAPDFEVVRIDDLHLDPANARKQTDENKSAIRASLARFGSGRSIVLDGKNVVRAGNGTLEGAMQEGFTEVLVVEPKPGQLVAVRRKDWTDSEATGYAIADNRAAELATWDDQVLAETLESLRSEPDLSIEATGFTDEQVDALLEKLAGEIAGEDEEEVEGGLVPQKFEVLVECRSEAHQKEVFERLASEGLVCRVLTL